MMRQKSWRHTLFLRETFLSLWELNGWSLAERSIAAFCSQMVHLIYFCGLRVTYRCCCSLLSGILQGHCSAVNVRTILNIFVDESTALLIPTSTVFAKCRSGTRNSLQLMLKKVSDDKTICGHNLKKIFGYWKKVVYWILLTRETYTLCIFLYILFLVIDHYQSCNMLKW